MDCSRNESRSRPCWRQVAMEPRRFGPELSFSPKAGKKVAAVLGCRCWFAAGGYSVSARRKWRRRVKSELEMLGALEFFCDISPRVIFRGARAPAFGHCRLDCAEWNWGNWPCAARSLTIWSNEIAQTAALGVPLCLGSRHKGNGFRGLIMLIIARAQKAPAQHRKCKPVSDLRRRISEMLVGKKRERGNRLMSAGGGIDWGRRATASVLPPRGTPQRAFPYRAPRRSSSRLIASSNTSSSGSMSP